MVRREAFLTALCALVLIALVIHTFSAIGQYRAKAITVRSVEFSLDSVAWSPETRLLLIRLQITNHGPEEVTVERLSVNLFGNAEFVTSKHDAGTQIKISVGETENYSVERKLSKYYADTLENLLEEGIDRWLLEGSAVLELELAEPVRISLRLRKDVE